MYPYKHGIFRVAACYAPFLPAQLSITAAAAVSSNTSDLYSSDLVSSVVHLYASLYHTRRHMNI